MTFVIASIVLLCLSVTAFAGNETTANLTKASTSNANITDVPTDTSKIAEALTTVAITVTSNTMTDTNRPTTSNTTTTSITTIAPTISTASSTTMPTMPSTASITTTSPPVVGSTTLGVKAPELCHDFDSSSFVGGIFLTVGVALIILLAVYCIRRRRRQAVNYSQF